MDGCVLLLLSYLRMIFKKDARAVIRNHYHGGSLRGQQARTGRPASKQEMSSTDWRGESGPFWCNRGNADHVTGFCEWQSNVFPAGHSPACLPACARANTRPFGKNKWHHVSRDVAGVGLVVCLKTRMHPPIVLTLHTHLSLPWRLDRLGNN